MCVVCYLFIVASRERKRKNAVVVVVLVLLLLLLLLTFGEEETIVALDFFSRCNRSFSSIDLHSIAHRDNDV